MSISKTIHYCWFGKNEKPKMAEKCIKSWKKYCPDYQIIEWNEDNFDVTKNRYCKEAYEAGKWAFVTDYARLYILYHHGGIYLDTDVELKRNIDEVLSNRCFMGIENSTRCILVATGLGIGAEKEFPLIKEMLDSYENISFYDENGKPDLTTCTVRNSVILKKHGYIEKNCFQNVAGAKIYPTEYFSPRVMENGKLCVTKNTFSIHHYSLSWTSKENQIARKKYLRKLKIGNFFYNIRVLPNNALLLIFGKERYLKLKKWIKREE